MELNKNKYAKKEVLDILNAYKAEYEKKFAEYREEIYRLREEVRQAETEVATLKNKEELIVLTLERAEQTAIDIKNEAQLQYALEIERLKKFSARWNAYFKELKEKYPLYPPVKKALDFKEKADKVLNNSKAKEAVSKLDNAIPKSKSAKFDPKSKIKDYIAATGNNGFNLDEVLHPGDLELEDLCKELGLIDGNE